MTTEKIFTVLDHDVAGDYATVAAVEYDGFSFKAMWLYDEAPDTSWIGEFSDTPEKGAIEHNGGKGTYKYFNPANPEYAKAEYERMCKLDNGDFIFIGCVVHVFKNDVKLATDSLWGIESDSDESFFIDTFNELAAQALSEAKAKLAELSAA